jgi:DNA ligase D-like protein (predicted 3'-phosphoesterase)
MDRLRNQDRKRGHEKKETPHKKLRRFSSPLHFVIQEHHISHIHFDLRLEWKGSLLSWIIPKNISMNPGIKRQAIKTINSTDDNGRYQGQENLIWDIGSWQPESEDVEEALKKGELSFRLEGRRVYGRFMMRRNQNKGKDHWQIWRMIDFDPWPGFIPPIKPLRRVQIPQGDEYLYELKNEGIRIEAQLFKEASLWTESKENWTKKLPLIAKGINELAVDSVILDGEIVSYDELGHTKLSLLQDNLDHHRFDLIHYVVSDILYLNGKDLRDLPLIERKLILEELDLPSYLEYARYFFEDGESFFQAAQSLNLEGIISKEIDSSYSGRKSWIEVQNPVTESIPSTFRIKDRKDKSKIMKGKKDKIVYEIEGISKDEVLHFYSDASRFIFKFLRNKKLKFLRCPKTSDGSCYWTDPEEGFELTSKKTVLKLVKNSVLEFHVKQQDMASEMILAIEADKDVSWMKFSESIFLLREILESYHLEGFIKAYGRRTFHIHIPFSKKVSWEKIHVFGDIIIGQLKAGLGDMLSLENLPTQRKEKIFLDLSMNWPNRSVIAPYSLRSGKLSFVCLPVSWDEISQLDHLLPFSLPEARKIIYSRLSDPWKNYESCRQQLDF